MKPEQLEQIVQAVKKASEESIEKTVNGKIRSLDKKIDDYIVADSDWKKTVQPVVDAYTSAHNFGEMAIWISKVVMAIGVIAGGIFWLKK